VTCVQCSSDLPEGVRICPRCRAPQPVRVHRGEISPGETIDLGYGRIVVQAPLGEGGMGTVWRAWLFFQPDDSRASHGPLPIALKVLHAQADESPALRALFANEAAAMKTLHHPNIVAFHDFFVCGRTVALAMELVEGSTLEDVISRHRARARVAAGGQAGVPVARAWYYFQQLLGALAATHAIGVVHGDVKPSNVLVRGDGIVKLSDYGIARLLPGSAVESSSPNVSAAFAVGTGAYMSPEQVLGAPLDARSDLYSAAIVLYEMLAGRPPFSVDDKSEFSLRHDQVESTPPPLGAVAADAPADLEPVLARALAKDPRYRYASAIELGQALRVAIGAHETPEWRAQIEIATDAQRQHSANDEAGRMRRLVALRELVLRGYRASNPSRPLP